MPPIDNPSAAAALAPASLWWPATAAYSSTAWRSTPGAASSCASDYQLDLAEVLDTLCLRVEMSEASLPANPAELPAGVPATLTVVAKLRFGDAAPAGSGDVGVTVTGSGIAGMVGGGHTDTDGVFTTSVTPSGSGTLALLVRACVDDGVHPRLRVVCDARTIGAPPTTTTTTPVTTTTTSTLAVGPVQALRRFYAMYVQSGTLIDRSSPCCTDFTTTTFDPVSVVRNWVIESSGSTGTAAAGLQANSTVVIDPLLGLQSVSVAVEGDGSFEAMVPFPPDCRITSEGASSHTNAPLTVEFRVFEPVAYQIIADATASADGGRARATVDIRLGEAGGPVTPYRLHYETETGRQESGATTGVLQPAIYRLALEAVLTAAPGAQTTAECVSQRGSVSLRGEALLTFAPL